MFVFLYRMKPNLILDIGQRLIVPQLHVSADYFNRQYSLESSIKLTIRSFTSVTPSLYGPYGVQFVNTKCAVSPRDPAVTESVQYQLECRIICIPVY